MALLVVLSIFAVLLSVRGLFGLAGALVRNAYAKGYRRGFATGVIAQRLPDTGPMKFSAVDDRVAASALIVKTGGHLPVDGSDL